MPNLFTLPVIFDVETVPLPCAADFVEPPDYDAIQAARNLKDPVKVAADLEQRRATAKAEYEASLERAGLDFNLAQIAVIGWTEDGGNVVEVRACATEFSEAAALQAFWKVVSGKTLCGFAARTFDVPMLIQRSRYLCVEYPELRLNRYGDSDVLDLRDLLTFQDMRYEAIMPRSLKMFCKRFDIQVDDAIAGADVAKLIAEGNWEAVLTHCTSDVRLTAQLAKRLGVLPQPAEVL